MDDVAKVSGKSTSFWTLFKMLKQRLPPVNIVENWLNLTIKVAAKNPPKIA
jgi:hypothetical protein